MHFEESDLSIRLLNNGYVVRLGWADQIDHYESSARNQVYLHQISARNSILYALHNVPFPYFLVHLPVTSFNSAFSCFRKGVLHLALPGMVTAYGKILRTFFWRKPVAGKIYLLSRSMKGRPSVPFEEMEPLLPPLQIVAAPGVQSNQPSLSSR
jgi:hypothetical protein